MASTFVCILSVDSDISLVVPGDDLSFVVSVFKADFLTISVLFGAVFYGQFEDAPSSTYLHHRPFMKRAKDTSEANKDHNLSRHFKSYSSFEANVDN